MDLLEVTVGGMACGAAIVVGRNYLSRDNRIRRARRREGRAQLRREIRAADERAHAARRGVAE